MKLVSNLPRRVAVYVIGQLILAFGSAISICTNLGISPNTSISYAVSVATGMKLSTCVIIVYSIMILLQVLLLGNNFNPVNLTQILVSFLFGYFMEFAQFVIGDFALQAYLARLIVLLVSAELMAAGIYLYTKANLVNMPPEGLIHTISEKWPNWRFRQIKTVMDCTLVILAAIITLSGTGQVQGVREGTILCALVVGPMMKPIQRVLQPWLDKFLSIEKV